MVSIWRCTLRTKIFGALLASILLLACVTAGEPKPASDMEEICQMLQLDCSDVDEPIVVITHFVPPGYYGMYSPGEPYVFVNTRYPMDQIRKTKFHEIVHYVVWETQFTRDRCESEALARRLTAEKFNEEEDPNWRERYGCNGH